MTQRSLSFLQCSHSNINEHARAPNFDLLELACCYWQWLGGHCNVRGHVRQGFPWHSLYEIKGWSSCPHSAVCLLQQSPLLALQLQPTSLKSFSDLSMEKEMSECTWRVTELKSVCEIYCKKEYRLEGIIVMCHIMGWTFSRQQMERRMRGATKWDKKKEEWQLWNKISSLPCTWLAETQHCFTFAELVANSYIYLLK